MTKFFRSIRLKLSENNKTGRYLKYAVGEIVLVVIGILIALALNNLHQKNQNEKYISTILLQIQKELEVDIKDAQRITDIFLALEPLVERVLTDSVTVEEYLANRSYTILRVSYVSFTTNQAGYHQLVNNLEILPDKIKGLVNDLNFLYVEYQDDIDGFNNKLREDAERAMRNDLEKYPESYQWVRTDSISVINSANHFLSDPFYKNQVLNHAMNLQSVTSGASGYRIEALQIHRKIDSLLNIKRDTYPEYLKFHDDLNGEFDEYLGLYKDKNGKLHIYEENDQIHMRFEADENNSFSFPIWRHSDGQYFVNLNGNIRFLIFSKSAGFPKIHLIDFSNPIDDLVKVND